MMASGADPFQAEIARITLAVAGQHGFALGGGVALAAHGVIDRPTEDVDVFTDIDGGVAAATSLVEVALRDHGFDVVVVDDGSDLAGVIDGMDRLMVEWQLSRGARVVRLSLSCQARTRRPVIMDLGPVIDLADLLAWKVAALVGRARERDYIDVAAVLPDYTPDQLLDMAREVDPGLEDDDVPMVGRRLDRLPDEAFFPYDLDSAAVAIMRQRFTIWPR